MIKRPVLAIGWVATPLWAIALAACAGHVDHGEGTGGNGQVGGASGGEDGSGGVDGVAGNTAGAGGERGGAGGLASAAGGSGGAAVDAGMADALPPSGVGGNAVATIVAVGYGNFRIRSIDGGKTWINAVSTRDAPTSEDKGDILRDVTFGNGLFVAVGPTVYTSRDGAKWDDRGNPIDTWMGGVTHGNGLFITGGWGGRYATSPDGITWTRAQLGTTNIRSAAAGGGLLAVAGDDNAVMVSPDGKTWQRQAGVNTNQVAYCQDAFRSKEDCRPSFGHGVYLKPDGAAIARSLDGLKWERVYDGVNRFYWVGSVFAFGASPALN